MFCEAASQRAGTLIVHIGDRNCTLAGTLAHANFGSEHSGAGQVRRAHKPKGVTIFYTDVKLQFLVRVEAPDPFFARVLQQAIGGIEGEIRVAMQYFFQACGARGNPKFRDLLMNTAAEELGPIEMLATAVALNLEGAPVSIKDEIAADPVSSAVLGGINMKNLLSAGLSAMPVDSDGIRFNMSHVYASGNVAADMTANVAAESTGRVLATRLYNLTTDPGMKEMPAYLIARDTMHQNPWLAAFEELGGSDGAFPIPNSFPQEMENRDFSYAFVGFQNDGSDPVAGRWSSGPSLDGKDKLAFEHRHR